jgi:hypothetical protein
MYFKKCNIVLSKKLFQCSKLFFMLHLVAQLAVCVGCYQQFLLTNIGTKRFR